MNYYPFHIGDYLSHTAHLEPMEDLAYRRMIDLYFIREACLPSDAAEVAKLIRLRGEVEVVASVLREFFVETLDGWANSRCDYEIGEAQSKRMKAKQSAEKRWGSDGNAGDKKPSMRSHSDGNAPNPNPNPNPKKKNNKSYPDDFEAAYAAYPARPGASKQDAYKAWIARINDGVEASVMRAGVERYAAYCVATSIEPKFIKQPSTFFGPGEHYLADWTSAQSVAIYSDAAMAVIDSYNALLGASGWPEAVAQPYSSDRAAAISEFVGFNNKPDGVAAYFGWLSENLPAKPGFGFDWAIKRETFLRAREGNFSALAA